MSLKLYTLDPSSTARAAMMVAELLQAPVQYIELDIVKGAHLEPAYLKKNPLHTIPLLEDGDLVIHDSHAIIIYLAEKYGKDDSLYPKDLQQRALVNQKLFFDTGCLFPRLRAISKPTEKQLKDIDEAFSFLEAILSNTKWIAGDKMTIADISAVATVSSLVKLLPLDSKKYPNTAVWLSSFESKPFYTNKNTPGCNILHDMIQKKWSS